VRSFDPDEAWTEEGTFDPFRKPETSSELKETLRREFEGKSLHDVIPGRHLNNDYGTCHRVAGTERGALVRCDRTRARDDLERSLQLVPGIRDRMHGRLAEEGYATLRDLEEHPRFGEESRRVRKALKSGSSEEIIEVFGQRLAASDPLVLRLAGFHRDTDFLFLDLETMGLFGGQPVILAGLARPGNDNTIRTDQFLARDFPDEAAIIAEVCHRIEKSPVLVTYNGKSFDVPFLEQRAAYYGIAFPDVRVHIDLLHFCRRTWKKELVNCTLTTIEQQVLGIARDEDLPGEMVPEFYQEYLLSGNAGFLKPIVDHNRQDIASLVGVFSSLTERWLTDEE